MIRKYIRQSWELIRSERLYTALYVAGVALSITTVISAILLALVLIVVVAGIYIPARGISRVNPVDAIRNE